MHFRVQHVTEYRYSRPVFLDPHVYRLRPREDGSQRLLDYGLWIEPTPLGRSDHLDAAGNPVVQAWFGGLSDRLRMVATFEVETLRSNPFEFILTDPGVMQVPVHYPPALATPLSPYLARRAPSEAVQKLIEGVQAQTGAEVVPFLCDLARRVHGTCQRIFREQGDPWPAHETLSRRQGSCRDLAVVYLEACRAVGLAARFVSGYREVDASRERVDLHAWAEVYLPGGGWRGFDPSLGLAVADRHVVLAAADQPAGAAPVSGNYRGSGVKSQLTYQVQVETLPVPAAA